MLDSRTLIVLLLGIALGYYVVPRAIAGMSSE